MVGAAGNTLRRTSRPWFACVTAMAPRPTAVSTRASTGAQKHPGRPMKLSNWVMLQGWISDAPDDGMQGILLCCATPVLRFGYGCPWYRQLPLRPLATDDTLPPDLH